MRTYHINCNAYYGMQGLPAYWIRAEEKPGDKPRQPISAPVELAEGTAWLYAEYRVLEAALTRLLSILTHHRVNPVHYAIQVHLVVPDTAAQLAGQVDMATQSEPAQKHLARVRAMLQRFQNAGAVPVTCAPQPRIGSAGGGTHYRLLG